MKKEVRKHPLNIYMGYSRYGGAEEGAILVFAHTSREARAIGWGEAPFDTEFIDFAALRLRNKDWLYEEANQEKLIAGIPHVNDNPETCSACECWGDSPIGDDGLCEECRDGYEDGYEEGGRMKYPEFDFKTLYGRRANLLQKTYQGHKPPREEWEKLIADFRKEGLEYGARDLEERAEKMR